MVIVGNGTSNGDFNGRNNGRVNGQMRVRFDSEPSKQENCDDDDYGGIRSRSTKRNNLEDGFRPRSSTVEVSTRSPIVEGKGRVSYDCLYQIVDVNSNGGTLQGLSQRHLELKFDKCYTKFNGASMDIKSISSIMRKGDSVIVIAREPHFRGEKFLENRASDICYPTRDVHRRYKISGYESNVEPDWVTHGRVLKLFEADPNDLRKRFVVSAGVNDGNQCDRFRIYASKDQFVGDYNELCEDITVMVRAERRDFDFFASNVQIVGRVKDGVGYLKQMPFGRKPFVIIASSFGYVMVSREKQKEIRQHPEMMFHGQEVLFKACANLPCLQASAKEKERTSIHQWRAISLRPSVLSANQVSMGIDVFDCGKSDITNITCRTCQGELVCLCYM